MPQRNLPSASSKPLHLIIAASQRITLQESYLIPRWAFHIYACFVSGAQGRMICTDQFLAPLGS